MIQYLLDNMWQLWAVLAVLGLILELTSGDFFIMCIAIGAMGAAIWLCSGWSLCSVSSRCGLLHFAICSAKEKSG